VFLDTDYFFSIDHFLVNTVLINKMFTVHHSLINHNYFHDVYALEVIHTFYFKNLIIRISQWFFENIEREKYIYIYYTYCVY